MLDRRELMLRVAWAYHGTWYEWGGDDPEGFDCSGYDIECAMSVGLLPDGFDARARDLWKLWEPFRIRGPRRGAFAFWKSKNGGPICHTEICLDEHFSIGAHGSRKVTDQKSAEKYNAFIKVRPIFGRTSLELVGFLDPLGEKRV